MSGRRFALARLVLLAVAAAGAAPPAAEPRDAPLADLLLAAPVLGLDVLRAAPPHRPRLVVARDDGLETLDIGSGERTGVLPRGASRYLCFAVAAEGGVERLQVVREAGGSAEVLEWSGGDDAPRPVLVDRDVRLPSGVYGLPFARDLDGDGDVDFVLPTPDGLRLHLRGGDGVEQGPTVRHRFEVDLDFPDPFRLGGRLGEEVDVPALDIADQNGDGHPDLLFRDDDLIQLFWSRPDGSLPPEPTVRLDLDEIRSGLPAFDRDRIDPSNLTRALDSLVAHEFADLDGDGCADLMLRQGPKVSIYRGSPDGVARDVATQVLRTGGNLVQAFLVDDNLDGHQDLGMLLVSDVSLGQVLLWLVAGGELTFDLYVYDQETGGAGPRFARKPSRRRTMVLDIPSLLRFVSSLEERVEKLRAGFLRVPLVVDVDGDGAPDDLLELSGERGLSLWLDPTGGAAIDPRPAPWDDVIRRFDREAGGRTKLEVGLEELIDWAPLPGRGLRRHLSGRDPDRRLDLPPARAGFLPEGPAAVFAADLDGDAAEELVFVESGGDRGPLRVVVLRP